MSNNTEWCYSFKGQNKTSVSQAAPSVFNKLYQSFGWLKKDGICAQPESIREKVSWAHNALSAFQVSKFLARDKEELHGTVSCLFKLITHTFT